MFVSRPPPAAHDTIVLFDAYDGTATTCCRRLHVALGQNVRRDDAKAPWIGRRHVPHRLITFQMPSEAFWNVKQFKRTVLVLYEELRFPGSGGAQVAAAGWRGGGPPPVKYNVPAGLHSTPGAHDDARDSARDPTRETLEHTPFTTAILLTAPDF
ncbi:hypothetical protein MBLNU230_g4501t1 [Neophaeotheca triangularis]